MNHLRGVSAGPGFPADHFDGWVHSVFGSAANLRLRDGRLVTLLTADHANQPRATRVDAPAGFRFEEALRAGQIAACRAGTLRFGGAAVQIELGGVWRWEEEIRALTLQRGSADGGALRIALDELARHPGARVGIAGAVITMDGEETAPARAAGGPIGALIAAARELDVREASAAAARLIGLGPGLTPSGDDFLAGFLAGAWAAAAGDAARARFVEALGGEIVRRSVQTNDISRGFLDDAARGWAAEPVIRLIEGVYGGERVSVRAAARGVLGMGSSSGADVMAGVVSAVGLDLNVGYRGAFEDTLGLRAIQCPLTT